MGALVDLEAGTVQVNGKTVRFFRIGEGWSEFDVAVLPIQNPVARVTLSDANRPYQLASMGAITDEELDAVHAATRLWNAALRKSGRR